MALQILRRSTSVTPPAVLCRFYSRDSSILDTINNKTTEASAHEKQSCPTNPLTKTFMSPIFNDKRPSPLDVYDIELVDNDAWRLSSGVAHAWQGVDAEREPKFDEEALDEGVSDGIPSFDGEPDIDEIDNMRVRGSLFYKIDRNSKEFEEYSFDFHRKKSSKRKDDDTLRSEKKESLKKESKMKENPGGSKGLEMENFPQIMLNDRTYNLVGDVGVQRKKIRTPTFNQLTAPYHEPFCLDISISKGSVRACVIHRVTSKVVVVAHSISKDMKFDLPSTRNAATCASVGKILAQRALADDIHDMVYTPRKGERLEGKLHIVLQSIIECGVNVKVKLKQRNLRKASSPNTAQKLSPGLV